jgi:hypothetical protein
VNALTLALLTAAAVFAGGLLGLRLDLHLPRHHLGKETQDAVRLTTTMLSVLTSLVLGLLIATAKEDSDALDREFRSYAADLILLDGTLREYGPAADAAREMLRRYAARLVEETWRPDGSRTALEEAAAATLLRQVRANMLALDPAGPAQTWLRDQSLAVVTTLLRRRWEIIEQLGPSVHPLMLTVVVLWIVAIFAGFGLSAPRNATVAVSFLVGAVAIGGAVFLIVDLNAPLDGFLHIHERPMRDALAHLSR